MTEQLPFLRYVAKMDIIPNNFFTKAHDCRFIYMLEGECEFYTKDKTFYLSVDSVLYYPSGIPYFLKSTGDKKIRFVTVNFDFDQENAAIPNVLPPIKEDKFDHSKEIPSYKKADKIFIQPFIIDRAGFLRADMLRLCEVASRQSANSRALANSILSVIILEILEKQNDPLAKDNLTKEVAKLVLKSYHENITISSIAAKLGYHPYYLGRLFKESMGESLHLYITKTRLKKSEDLLAHSDLSVGEIAHLCGFANADHFSKLFHQIMEQTPTDYRNRYRMI